MSETLRTFIALEIPPQVQAELESLEKNLKAGGCDISFVRPENIHLTLKFLGEIPKELVEEVKKIVLEVAKAQSPLTLHLSGVGVFPDARRPRVVWVGIDRGSAEIIQLYEALESKLSQIGFPREPRPFMTHLTIGRIRGQKKAVRLGPLLEKITFSSAVQCTAGGITFFKSELFKTGPVYTKMLEANFKST